MPPHTPDSRLSTTYATYMCHQNNSAGQQQQQQGTWSRDVKIHLDPLRSTTWSSVSCDKVT